MSFASSLTPIWRKDKDEVRKCCDFPKVGETIREAGRDIPGAAVIDCYEMVPEDEKYFADFRLHPNDEGFRWYSEGLLKALAKMKL